MATTNDVVTNLLGEIVEVFDGYGGDRLMVRGPVRAVLTDSSVNGPMSILVENDERYSERYGCLELHRLGHCRVRVVEECTHCGMWEPKKRLRLCAAKALTARFDGRVFWEHRDGEGCRKIGTP